MLVRQAVVAFTLASAAGCATSSASNYSVQYKAVGSATETQAFNDAAEKAFKEDVGDEEKKRAIASIKVFLDSVPPDLTLRDNVVQVADGASATLVGIVEVTAVWMAPSDDADVLPALQKAASAAQADLAFCPRNQKPQGYAWRCYLVRQSAAPSQAKETRGNEI